MEEIKKLVLNSTIMLVTSIYVLSFHFFCRGYEEIKHTNKDIECKQIEVTARLEKQEKELNR